MKREAAQVFSSSSKKTKPSPPSASPAKPSPEFYPVPRDPRNERFHKKERIFLHHSSPAVRPKILHVSEHGQVETQKTALPSSSGDRLLLVGQSQEKVCFQNSSANSFVIWDLKEEKMEKEVEVDSDVPAEFDSDVPAAIGFGHTRNGNFKIVRFLIPPSPEGLVYCVEICNQNLVWVKRMLDSDVICRPCEGSFAKLVYEGEDRSLFGKGGVTRASDVQIIKFDLENETLGLVQLPPEPFLTHTNMSIGNGFSGRLSLSVYVPSIHGALFSRLLIWILERNQATNEAYWHKLLSLPMEASTLIEPFVPLVFFYGRSDGGVYLVFHRDEEQIFQVLVRGREFMTGPIIPPFSYTEKLPLPMVSNRFQATPLRPKLVYTLELRKPKLEEDKPMKWDDRLSFADDID